MLPWALQDVVVNPVPLVRSARCCGQLGKSCLAEVHGQLSLSRYPRQTSEMEHWTPPPSPPTFLQLCPQALKKFFDSVKLPYSNWQNAVLYNSSPENTMGMVLIIAQAKQEAEGFTWLFTQCMRAWGWAWKTPFGFPPFIPLLLLYISTCPLGKGADWSWWETTGGLHLANT